MLSSWRDLRSSKRMAFILFTSCSQIYSSSGNRVREVKRAGPLWWLLAITAENEVHRQHHEQHWQRGGNLKKNPMNCRFSVHVLLKPFLWFLQKKSVRLTLGIKTGLLHLNSINELVFVDSGNGDGLLWFTKLGFNFDDLNWLI